LQQGQITASSPSSSDEDYSERYSSPIISAIFSSIALISSFTISSFFPVSCPSGCYLAASSSRCSANASL
jgi:hypothetical protein